MVCFRVGCFCIDQAIPTVLEKPVKGLGRSDDATFSYKDQIQGLKQKKLEDGV